MKTLTLIFLATLAAAAQPPKPTKLGAHILGETFAEWLSVNQLDLNEICQPKPRVWYYRTECRLLTGIATSGGGEVRESSEPTKDRRTHFYSLFSADEVVVPHPLLGTLVFWRGKLAGAQMDRLFLDTDAAGELKLLEEAYGSPTTLRTVPYQNGFGARFDLYEARWVMPDGALISATETRTKLLVEIVTSDYQKELLAREQAARKPNPYK